MRPPTRARNLQQEKSGASTIRDFVQSNYCVKFTRAPKPGQQQPKTIKPAEECSAGEWGGGKALIYSSAEHSSVKILFFAPLHLWDFATLR